MTNTMISVDELSIDELLDLKDAIEARLDALAKLELATIETRLERLKVYMNGHDAEAPAPAKTAAERVQAPAKKAAPKAKPAQKPKRTKKVKAKATTTSKLPPKYRDPATGKTWSGRGPAPSWLREHAAKRGNSREDLAV